MTQALDGNRIKHDTPAPNGGDDAVRKELILSVHKFSYTINAAENQQLK